MKQHYWYPAYLGLGSNMDKPSRQLKTALTSLSNHPRIRVISVSSFYQSEPYGGVEQEDFINAVAAVLTTLTAQDLLHALLKIELGQGRERTEHWGPRTLDLDLLVYSDQTSDNTFLHLPHPEIAKREFVLMPLAEIAYNVYIPHMGRVFELLGRVTKTKIKKVDN